MQVEPHAPLTPIISASCTATEALIISTGDDRLRPPGVDEDRIARRRLQGTIRARVIDVSTLALLTCSYTGSVKILIPSRAFDSPRWPWRGEAR
jgi:hypothetical protein